MEKGERMKIIIRSNKDIPDIITIEWNIFIEDEKNERRI